MRVNDFTFFHVYIIIYRLTFASGVTLSCTPDGAVEVLYGKQDNTVTCTHFGAASIKVMWTVGNPTFPIGSCEGENRNYMCDADAEDQGFVPSRPSADLSVMTINADLMQQQQQQQSFIKRPLICTVNRDNMTCPIIDLIYPAEATCTYAINSLTWTVSAVCNITKVLSDAGRYSCHFLKGDSLSSQNTEVQKQTNYSTSSQTGSIFKTGSCSFNNSRIPGFNGEIYFRALILPGYVNEVFGPLTIASPPSPTFSCKTISEYLVEDSELQCSCISGSVGEPPGRLMWIIRHNTDVDVIKNGNYGATLLELNLMINRTHNSKQLRCDVDWVSVASGQSLTLSVSYGPDAVSILQNRTFYTDSSGNLNLTLNCQPEHVHPSTNLTYTWTGPCATVKSNTCIFKPRPPGFAAHDDINATITCSVTNNFSFRTASTHFILDLKYAPKDAPVINGYKNSDVLYQGDAITLTCTIMGGDPSISTVTISCGKRYDNTSSGQTGQLTVKSLNALDHGAVCTCRGQWTRPEYYIYTDSRNLTVYYPPSIPSLTRPPGTSWPMLEGDNVTLTCQITNSGHPKANITWTNNGKVVHTSDVTSTVFFDNVSNDHNGLNVICHATNNFTQHRQIDLNSSLQLNVFYKPRLEVRSNGGGQCTAALCVVSDGRPLNISCVADSNPPPDHYSWTLLDGRQVSASPELIIPAVTRNHSGLYSVVVVTGKPDSSDARLPLSASSNLTILVKYGASNTILRLNRNTSSIVTVLENDTVTTDCMSYGRPTPNIQLFKDGYSMLNATGNILALAEEENSLTHKIYSAKCNNTGTYSCMADNEVGKDQGQEVKLRVNCRPRKTLLKDDLTKVTYTGQPVTLTFSLEAVPVPDQYSFHHYSALTNSSFIVGDDISFNATCFKTFGDQHEYAVTCNLTVSDVTDSSGVYSFRAGNDYGYEEFWFKITYTYADASQSAELLNVGGLAGGLVAGVLLLVAVAAAVYIMRKRIKRKDGLDECSSRKSLASLSQLGNSRPVSARSEHLYEIADETEATTNQAGTVHSSSTGTPSHDVYAVVQKKTTGRQDNSAEAHPEVSVVRLVKKAINAKADSADIQKPKKRPQEKKAAKPNETRRKDPISTPLSMKPMSMSENVYENHAFESDEPKPKDTTKGKQSESAENGQQVREEKLVYTTIAFTQAQNKKSIDPSPQRDVVEYASIDFTNTKKD